MFLPLRNCAEKRTQSYSGTEVCVDSVPKTGPAEGTLVLNDNTAWSGLMWAAEGDGAAVTWLCW